MTTTDQPFGHVLLAHRQRLGLSQHRAGAIVGVSKFTIRSWEKLRTKPNPAIQAHCLELFSSLLRASDISPPFASPAPSAAPSAATTTIESESEAETTPIAIDPAIIVLDPAANPPPPTPSPSRLPHTWPARWRILP